MPIRPEHRHLYRTPEAKAANVACRERARGKCEWCGAANHAPHPVTGSKVVLTVSHLNHDPTDHRMNNIAALCQRCHLRYDAEHHARTRRSRKTAS